MIPPAATAIPLSALLGEVEAVVAHAFEGRQTWVVAETSDVKPYPSKGWTFLRLLERRGDAIAAKADAVIWRSAVVDSFFEQTGVRLQNNLSLMMLVSVSFRAAHGFSLQVHRIDPAYTLGQQEAQRRQVLATVSSLHPGSLTMRDGQLVSANHLRPLPVLLRHLVLVGAPGSDGERDFVHELKGNPYGYAFRITSIAASVQGREAPAQLARALHEAAHVSDADAVVLIRGGGSDTDLSAFDSLEVSLAICLCPLPVLTGIGHQRNVSLADLLAHTPLKTPTKVAAFVVERHQNVDRKLQEMQQRVMRGAASALQLARYRIEGIPERIEAASARYLERRAAQLSSMQRIVQAHHPQRWLQRGFVAVSQNGHTITRKKQVDQLQPLLLTFADGTLTATPTAPPHGKEEKL